jgi:hypothetical protein
LLSKSVNEGREGKEGKGSGKLKVEAEQIPSTVYFSRVEGTRGQKRAFVSVLARNPFLGFTRDLPPGKTKEGKLLLAAVVLLAIGYCGFY